MSNDFLRRLYWACSSGLTPFTEDNCNLSLLYEATQEAHDASERFSKALYAAGLDSRTESSLETLSGEEVVAVECQGFINGFRLGMKLAGELGEEPRYEH